jgi:hypothetical protein
MNKKVRCETIFLTLVVENKEPQQQHKISLCHSILNIEACLGTNGRNVLAGLGCTAVECVTVSAENFQLWRRDSARGTGSKER